MNMKNKLSVLIISFTLVLSFSAAKADGLILEQAQEKIALLEKENQSLKVRLKYFTAEIAEYRKRLDLMIVRSRVKNKNSDLI